MNKIILNVQLVLRKLSRVEVVARYALEEKKQKHQEQQETKEEKEKKKIEAYLFSKCTH